MSVAFKNRVPNETHRKNLSIALTGHIVTDKTKSKIKKQLKIKKDSGEWKINTSGLRPHTKGEFHHSEETKQTLRAQRKGIPLSAERRRLISAGQTGKVFTPERRKNISLSLIGKTRTVQQRKNMSLAHLGVKHSAERNKAKSLQMIGHEVSAETRKLIGEKNKISLLGKKQSPETIKKRAQKLTGQKRTPEQNAAQSIRSMGHYVSNETRKKEHDARVGKTMSEISRQLIGAASKSRWEDPKFKTKTSANMQGKIRSDATKALMSSTWKEILSDPIEVQKRMKNSGVKHLIYVMKNGDVVKMRSGWEVKFAAYLDSLNILWLYEPSGFMLSSGHQYFPDFYLPETNEWREIKGWMSKDSQEKLNLFAKEYPNEKLIILQGPDLKILGLKI